MGKVPLNIAFIAKAFFSAGFILITKEYKNNKQLLEYVCCNGHKHFISWHGFQGGNRCPYCSNKIKKTYKQIKEAFEKEGYILLSKKYINAHIKLNYLCDKEHNTSISWANFQQGKRCGVCAGNVLLNYTDVRNIFEKESYTLLSKSYVNSNSKLKYKCPNGHNHSTTLGNFNFGYRCPTCAIIKQCGEGHWNLKGGLSFQKYCPIWSDKYYKAAIRTRDNNICQNPYCFKTDNVLNIHHIDYNKKNCDPNNLITVCRSCNSRANFDRNWHTEWYQALMYHRFKGQNK